MPNSWTPSSTNGGKRTLPCLQTADPDEKSVGEVPARETGVRDPGSCFCDCLLDKRSAQAKSGRLVPSLGGGGKWLERAVVGYGLHPVRLRRNDVSQR